MLIICPKCDAKYKIPDGITLSEGQKLKCSACGAVFEKGEEAPLVLTEAVTEKNAPTCETPAPESLSIPPVSVAPDTPPTDEAFSQPLYTMPERVTPPQNTLPEAFQPLPPPEKSSKLWLIPLYFILIIALCLAGWLGRGLLKPQFQTILPPIEDKPVTLPMTEHDLKPVVAKTIDSTLPPAQAAQPVVLPAPVATESKSLKNAPDQPTAAPIPTSVIPMREPTPASALPAAEDIPLFPDGDKSTPAETPDESLFTLPILTDQAPTDSTLTLGPVSFRTEPDEQQQSQLLIEGTIQNTGDTARLAPVLTVYVLGMANDIIAQKSVHLTTPEIQAGETLPFYTGITPAPAGVDHIRVRF